MTECKVEGELIPPEFTDSLMDTVAKEGQPHQLTCRVMGYPVPTVSWYKNGVCVDNCQDYSIAYDGNSGDCYLSFEEVFIEDQAEYVCRAQNLVGEADTGCHLLVERKPPFLFFSFLSL